MTDQDKQLDMSQFPHGWTPAGRPKPAPADPDDKTVPVTGL